MCPHLVALRDQRNHYLELVFLSYSLNLAGRFEDRSALHTCDFGEQKPETTTAKTEHRVGLANAIDLAQQRAFVIALVENLVHRARGRRALQGHLQFRKLSTQFFRVREKLVQWRIEKTDRDRQSGHLAKDPDEVAALQR